MKKIHVITSQNNEQMGHGLKRSDVVILNAEYKSHTRVEHSKEKGLNNAEMQS